MAKQITFQVSTYPQLVKAVKFILTSAQETIRITKADALRQVGQYISHYVLHGKDRAKYGEHVFENLSKDLNIGVKNLHRAVRFFKEFSIGSARTQLPLTHLRDLLTLPDSPARKSLIKKAIKEKLTSRELAKEIKKHKAITIPQDGPIPQLKFTRGKLLTYQTIKTPEAIEIDFGFKFTFGPEELGILKMPKAEMIEVVSVKPPQVKAVSANLEELYTYKAKVVKIVDGDTQDVKLFLGLGMTFEQRLRLRGIDCPEIDTPEGKKAKRFVEARLKDCDFIVIKTYKDKTDKWARYLADVFYKPGETDMARIALEGTYLNQELLDNRLAVAYSG